jgi:hypothetical protein
MLNETSVYGDDVDEFRPERFMKGDDLDPSVPIPAEAFGFGRRICAGRASAEASLWITIASMLSVFKLEGPEGFTEKDYGNFITGLIVYAHSIMVETVESLADKTLFITRSPPTCQCSITPRSVGAAALIESSCVDGI